jgi:hypothetical protein
VFFRCIFTLHNYYKALLSVKCQTQQADCLSLFSCFRLSFFSQYLRYNHELNLNYVYIFKVCSQINRLNENLSIPFVVVILALMVMIPSWSTQLYGDNLVLNETFGAKSHFGVGNEVIFPACHYLPYWF